MAKIPNKDQRFRRLLEAGYLPEEIPPPFVSTEFAKWRSYFRNTLDPDAKHSAYSKFSIPRHNSARRILGIPNPINYFFLCAEIADNWIELRKFIKGSKISEFRPIFDLDGPRSLFGVNFSHVESEISRLQAIHNRCIRVDISRFYPTIYTHSIGWALYTKKYVKANLHKSYKNSLADRLDRHVRYCQENQSVGMVIGPDTSRILSEIIGVAIETQLRGSISNFDRRAVRYVDDIVIGIDFDESHEQLISNVAAAFSEYGLEMNVDKTRLIGKGERFHPEWVSELRNYRLTTLTRRKDEVLEDYFKNAFYLSSENDRENVLTYAVKRSRSFSVDDNLWNIYEDYLYRCARYNTNCISSVFQIIIERNYIMSMDGRSVDLSKARSAVVDIIKQYSPLGCDYEVSWALFLCKALKIKLSNKDISPVLPMTSATCALITLDLQSLGLIPKGADLSYWRTFANSDGLRSDMWLFAYEIAQKNWMPNVSKDYVANDKNFGKLLSKAVYFYDEKKNVKSTRAEKQARFRQIARIKFVTNRWEEYF